MEKEKWNFESKYLIFYLGWQFDFSFEICGYFDNRPRINLDLFFFNLTLILPFRNKWTDECDPPKWGIAYHGNTFWIYRGGKGNMNGGSKWWTMRAPWYWQWVRTSTLRRDGTREHETRGSGYKHLYRDEWKNIIWSEAHPYTYILKHGTVQNRTATIKVSEMEWRLHWLKWLPFPKKIRKYIDINFDGEVGEGTGSWKGGVVGCSYDLLPNETPIQCLRRMEKERKFL